MQHLRNNKIDMKLYNIKQLWKSKEKIVRELFNTRIEALNLLAVGALQFNYTLKDKTLWPDIFVDMQHYLSEDLVTNMMEHYGVLSSVQVKGWSNMHISAVDYEQIMDGVQIPMSTSDETHPTDRVYMYMWIEGIAPALLAGGACFGRFSGT